MATSRIRGQDQYETITESDAIFAAGGQAIFRSFLVKRGTERGK